MTKQRKKRRGREMALAKKRDALAKEYAALRVLDPRSADEIIGYDENGMWPRGGDFSLTDIPVIKVTPRRRP